MLLLRTVIVAFIIGVASSLRNCDSCIEIDECPEAVELVTTKKSVESGELVKRAFCGMKNEHIQVCCSDFSIKTRLQSDDVEKNGDDEIENHPNLSLLPKECGRIEGLRIIGGSSPSLYEFPWLALISHRIKGALKFNCGGSVINERYILTAAHCIKNHIIAGVRIGEYDTSKKVDCYGVGPERVCESNIQDIAVSQTHIHPQYTRIPITVYDIGLLRLKKPVNFSHMNAGAICLPVFRELRENDLSSEVATVAGWGVTESQKESSVVLKVTIPIYSTEECKRHYDRNSKLKSSEKRFESTLCAGEDGKDSCNGDSGSPLILESSYNESFKFVQYGIVSYGPSQCGTNTPGVYTDVRKFMKWILDSIQP